MKKILSLFCLFVFSFSVLTGCGEKTVKYGHFYYDLSTSAKNLDPQTASSQEAFLVIANIMDGLVKYSDSNEIVPALASSWEISEDEQTYTFHLRENVQWVDATGSSSDDTATFPYVTADDFVFAFERLFDPNNNASEASRYHIIQNADAVLAGQMDTEALGVVASDDQILVITLEVASPAFLSLLAQPPAFPCNRTFFYNTGGTYGLSPTSLLYCGGFYLSKWRLDADSPFYTLDKNTSYYDASTAKADNVTFTVVPEEKDRLSNFQREETDSIILSGDAIRQIDLSAYDTSPTVDTTWALLFNTQKEPFTSVSVRQSLSNAILSGSIQDAIPAWMTPATSPIPPSLGFENSSYRDEIGEVSSTTPLNDGTREALQAALTTAGLTAFPEVTLAYPEGDEYTALAQRLQRIWRDELGIYINATPLPMADLENMADEKNYDLIFLPLRSDNVLPITFLEQFVSTSSNNDTGFSSEAYDALYNQYSPFSSKSENNALCKSMEELLKNEVPLLPIAYQASYFIMNDNAHDILYNPETNLLYYSKAYLDAE